MTDMNDTFIRDLLLSWVFIFILCVWFSFIAPKPYVARKTR